MIMFLKEYNKVTHKFFKRIYNIIIIQKMRGILLMFGKDKGKSDHEIAEIKTGTLNLYYVDRVTEKRKSTNQKKLLLRIAL